MNPAWSQQVNEQGFAVVPEVLSRRVVLEFLETLQHIPIRRTRAGIRHALACSAVADFVHREEIMGMAREILGPGALPFRASLFEKSPEANWLVAWHQDTALPLREWSNDPDWGPWSAKQDILYAHAPARALARVLALRISLDDSTSLNGSLRVLPATHTLGVLSEDRIRQLTAETPAVECPVPQGGVLAMRPLLLHASSKSRSNSPRRVLHVEFAPSALIALGFELAIA
ncbi:MAG TPA: phytanoyl-CoA dioxygenase family protein [Verrucomicrobiae bacterium]|nr:phytanoyl-CoA dioxygenase family protein [Verrucomicrobiae bacterium]